MQNIASPPQANAEVVINENFVTLSHQQVYGLRQPVTTGLTWGYYGGRWGGFSVSDGTLTLTNTATNYIVVEIATGAITVSTATTNWNDTTDYARVYQLTVAGGVVTVINDYRAGPGGIFGGGTGGGGGSGDVSGPGASTDNALVRWDGAAGTDVQDSGVLVTNNNEISGYRAHLNQQTGTTYTLDAADAGKIVELANGSAIALTVPNSFPVGFSCMVVQGGAGQVTIASTGSGTVVNRQSHTKTAGENAGCTLYVRSNSGTNAVWWLGGDTSA